MNEVASLSEYIEFIANKKHLFYRGHSDIAYKLEPSVYRRFSKGSLVKYEHEIIREAISLNVAEFAGHRTNFEKLTLMQHYGFPTRLLDLTENPLIALYFAVSSKEKRDGCVKALTIPASLIRHYDSDVVSVLSAFAYIEPEKFKMFEKELLANIEVSRLDKLKMRAARNKQQNIITTLRYYYKNNAGNEEKRECVEILNRTQLLDYLVYEIQKEKANFKNIISPLHFDNAIVCVRPKLSNQRLIAQQGAFLIYGVKDADKSKMPDIEKANISIENIVIPADKKSTLLDELETIGITEQRVFPEIETSAKYIVKRFKRKL